MAIIGGVAPIVAPLIGAQLLILSGWRGPFVALTVIGLILTASVAIGLPESLPRERRSSSGVRPALRAMAMLTRDVDFMGYTITSALVFIAFFAYLTGSSFVYQEVYGLSATTYSLLFALNAVGMLAASQVNHRLLARFSPEGCSRSPSWRTPSPASRSSRSCWSEDSGSGPWPCRSSSS